MAGGPIPQHVGEFITENIDSIAELEALLLLRRDPNVDWSAAALAQRLYTSKEQAEDAAAKLVALSLSGLKHGRPITYHYEPESPELEAMISEVADTYSEYLVPVTNLIHSKPQSKVKQFADAFKLRNREDK